MPCSVGADTAALGRGTRCTDKPYPDYQVVLPHLPSGTSVLYTVFLHADVKSRPYRVEHFRDALARLALLPEVVALGAFQMNHVWTVTFRDEASKKKMLAAETFNVKDQPCVVYDPCNQGIRLKLYWLLHFVHDDEVRAALAPYGKVTDIAREKWRVQVCNDKGSTTRLVTLLPKPGITVEDLPHQVRVAENLALVHVPGRPPLCLRCNGTGHIRRECRIPRCALCRRFGHEEQDCVRSYAAVTSPVKGDEMAEHIMDHADADAASRATTEESAADSTPSDASPLQENSTGPGDSQSGEAKSVLVGKPTNDQNVNERKHAILVSASVTTAKDETEGIEDVEMTAAAKAAAKRPREATDGSQASPEPSSSGEPSPKTAITRRMGLKPKPKIPPDRRSASTLTPT
ncbi:uncharacterized protein LOC142578455 [Dermacentor variabilis]|uniref:uncharacterized protein LOC142578455 n=1 Tax=Dermacentor variabilis TaxID=34621 RepID=UPI003F5C2906